MTGEPVLVRLQPELTAPLDAWRREQPDMPNRPEAMRRLLTEHLKAKGYLGATDTSAGSRRSQAVTARKAAGAAIDRVQNRDSDTPEDVKAYRKKKLMKIPSKLTKRSG